MKKARTTLLAALPVAMLAIGALPATANAQATTTTYTANLAAINGSNGSGSLTLKLSGNQAVVSEHFSGLATTFNGSPYPHVQHIHTGGMGVCPTMAADANGDGVISTTEGHTAYGMVSATLSVSGDTSAAAALNVQTAPTGGSATYQRTITLDPATVASIQSGKAVVVVHGLDPSTLSATAQAEKSDLTPSLPLAATSPALCGTLVAAQMSTMPTGGAATGGGSTAGFQHIDLVALGGGLVLIGAAGALAAGRRRSSQVQ